MMEAIKAVFKEHHTNKSKLWLMSKDHMRKQTIRTSLGMGWVFMRDFIYFAVFVLFRYLMSGEKMIEGMHFILYIMTGLVPWFFMNEVINSGVNAIKQNSSIVQSIKFPITILPTIEVVAIFLKRLFTILIAFSTLLMFGNLKDFNIFLFIYYFSLMFLLMVALNLITSALVAISDDFNQLYMAVTRVMFFSMPIIWSFEFINHIAWAKYVLKLNPMTYIILGFRDAFVLGRLPDFEYSIYFFVVLLVMFCVGASIQYKLRRYYSDFM